MTDDLVAFIQARADEDATVAEKASHRWFKSKIYDKPRPPNVREMHIARHDPARVLRSVEGKRRIIQQYENIQRRAARRGLREGDQGAWELVALEVEDILRAIATEWSDHPAYQVVDKWAPPTTHETVK